MARSTMQDVAAENAALLARGYEAFARGDLVAVEQLFDPDLVWHANRLGRLGGDHHGWPEVLSFFGRTMELTSGTFHIDVQDIMSNENGAVAIVDSRGHRGDKTLDSRQTHVYRMEDGKVKEVWQLFADSSVTEDFWS